MKTLLAPLAITAVVFLMNSPIHANVEAPKAATPKAAPATTAAPEHTSLQLADEITRRIRRLGVHVIRFPNTRPTEMIGEIC